MSELASSKDKIVKTPREDGSEDGNDDGLEDLDTVPPQSSSRKRGPTPECNKAGLDYDHIIEKIIKHPGQSLEYLTMLSDQRDSLRKTNEEEMDIWEEYLPRLASMDPSVLTRVMSGLSRHLPMDLHSLRAYLDGASYTHTNCIAEQAADMFENLSTVTEYNMTQMNVMNADMEKQKKKMSALWVQLRSATQIASTFGAEVEKLNLLVSNSDIIPPTESARSQESEDYEDEVSSGSGYQPIKVQRIEGSGLFTCDQGTIRLEKGIPVGSTDYTPLFNQLYKFLVRQNATINSKILNKDMKKLLRMIASNQKMWAEMVNPKTDAAERSNICSEFMKAVRKKEWQWTKLNERDSDCESE